MSASDNQAAIQKLYIAYFNRPADIFGLQHWGSALENGGTVAAVANSFAQAAEYKALFAGKTNAEIVTTVYKNLFGREPEPTGLVFWTGLLDSGDLTVAEIVRAVMEGAQNSDVVAINNKLIAANAFTTALDTAAEIVGYSGANAVKVAAAYLASVNASTSSLPDTATVNKAVADATGTGSVIPVGTGTGTPTPAPAFTATADHSGAVTFQNAGTTIDVTKSGSTYTFTTNGASAGTATITSAVNNIELPVGKTVSMASTIAPSSFTGTGPLTLTDTAAVSAATLNIINSAVTGLVSSSTITEVSGFAGDIKTALEANTEATALKLTALHTVNYTDAILAADLDRVVFANNTTLTLPDGSANELIMANATVGAGKTLTIDGSALSASTLTFNGELETDGSFIIRGGSADDYLKGGSGADTLIGGGGADTFDLGSVLSLGMADTIKDFVSGRDKLKIVDLTIDHSHFVVGVPPTTDPTLIYNSTTGELVYDSNGSDSGGETLVATIFFSGTQAATLLLSDFI